VESLGLILEPRGRLRVIIVWGRSQSKRWLEREIGVGAAESGDKVNFKSPDGSLGSIAAVDMRRGELEINLFAWHEVLEQGGGFVVKALELPSEASGC
jgi:hypothetical protein